MFDKRSRCERIIDEELTRLDGIKDVINMIEENLGKAKADCQKLSEAKEEMGKLLRK